VHLLAVRLDAARAMDRRTKSVRTGTDGGVLSSTAERQRTVRLEHPL